MASSSDRSTEEREKPNSRWDKRDNRDAAPKSGDSFRRYQDEDRRQERNRSRDEPYGRDERSSHRPGRSEPRSSHNSASSSEVDRNRGENPESTSKEPFKPNFKTSGALAAAARTNESGVVMKYATPLEARVPTLKWRLFPFKGEEALEPISVNEKSVYLLGRDRDVCDIPLDHLSCSTQHAVIVHRQVSRTDPETGLKAFTVRPYLMDLESRNGTFLNDVRIDDSRYYELFEKDAIRFGASSREFIILNEKSK